MPWNEDLDVLAALASEARAHEGWSELAEYWAMRSQGLRQPALQTLRRFLESAQGWPLAERIRLCRWIGQRLDRMMDQNVLMPAPLARELVTPSLRQWIEAEPQAGEPWYWLARMGAAQDLPPVLDLYRRAFTVDPGDHAARRAFARTLINFVDYDQHELPIGYLGDPQEDRCLLVEAEHALAPLGDAVLHLAEEAVLRRRIAEAWLSFVGFGGEFESWSGAAEFRALLDAAEGADS